MSAHPRRAGRTLGGIRSGSKLIEALDMAQPALSLCANRGSLRRIDQTAASGYKQQCIPLGVIVLNLVARETAGNRCATRGRTL